MIQYKVNLSVSVMWRPDRFPQSHDAGGGYFPALLNPEIPPKWQSGGLVLHVAIQLQMPVAWSTFP